jgi:hypothetical protein
MSVLPVSTDRVCNKCGKPKPITAFVKHKRMTGGRTNICRSCNLVRWKELRAIADEKADGGEMGISEKRCRDCGETKPLSAFFTQKYGVGGRRSRCKACQKITTSAKRKALWSNPEWRAKNRNHHRDYNLRRTYGISRAEYFSKLEAQGGLCAICGLPETAFKKKSKTELRELCVDHCHKTGNVRDLLCHKCNHGLGQFRDNPSLLLAAIAYLERHRE